MAPVQANIVVLREQTSGAFLMTIPKSFVFALLWKKGDSISFVFDKHNNLLLKKVSKTLARSSACILQRHENLSFFLTVPKPIVHAKNWDNNTRVQFIFNSTTYDLMLMDESVV